MALQKQMNAFGVTFPEGYIRVTSGSWTALSGQITANVEVFASLAARTAAEKPISAFSISFPIDLNSTQNVVAQAYLAIKARPEFADALDV